jgi:flagellar motor switch protein FliN
MSQAELTPRDALLRLGASTAEAVAQVLEIFAAGQIERGEVSVVPEAHSPFADLVRGTVAVSVQYVDGVTGANIFVLPPAGVRKLAEAMGLPPSEDAGDGTELSELELSAVSEASNQMMAAAAAAIGVVIGQEIDISVPDMRVIEDPSTAGEIYGSSPHACSTTFLIGGESCRLIQLVPSAFVVRMARALDELGAEAAPLDGGGPVTEADQVLEAGASIALVEALGAVKVRVWAELGRTQLALGRALGLPRGCVVELDTGADAPVDLYVNGLRFAQGQLLVTDDGEWAFRCETIGHQPEDEALRALPSTQPEQEGAVA